MTNKKLHKTLKLKKLTIAYLNTEVVKATTGVRESEAMCDLTDTCNEVCHS
jgi:hypothetical protein